MRHGVRSYLLALCSIGHSTEKPGMAPNNERRRHPRRPVALQCRVEGAAAPSAMQLGDLSANGCFVATADVVPIGSQLTLWVAISGAEISLPGRVVRVQPGRGFGFAIDVDGLTDSARFLLQWFLAARSPSSATST